MNSTHKWISYIFIYTKCFIEVGATSFRKGEKYIFIYMFIYRISCSGVVVLVVTWFFF